MFGSTLQGGSNGSGNNTNNTNNWGSSTGFGNASSLGAFNGPSNGTLFGNSSSNATGTSLFGNSTSNTSSNGLFGNSVSNMNKQEGLLGNQNKVSTGGGLFGNSKPASGGLFGGSSANTQTSNNLFGSTALGNPTNLTTSNLFGNTKSTIPTLGNLSNNTNTNLLGASTGNNLFSNNLSTLNQSTPANPYGTEKIFNDLQKSETEMPKSITENLFTNTNNKEISERRGMYSQVEKTPNQRPKRSSLLDKLGQTLKYFRYSHSPSQSNNFTSIKGLFTQSNFVTSKSKHNILPKTVKASHIRVTKPSYSSIDSRGMKRLVIKSKPLKFHLIDADKVLNTKKRRIISEVVLSDKLLTDYVSDEDESDNENIMNSKHRESSRFPYKVSADVEKDNDSKKGDFKNDLDENHDEGLDDKDINDGYWCTPSLKELSELSVQDLSNVENFIIGRIGHGQIAYNYPVDLSGIAMICKEKESSLNKELFGNIIEIGSRVVKVYQDAENKPPIGFGLNIPATISLEGIRPRDSESRADFIRYLQRQIGMEFVTYDPITCIWTFKVKHFSIWGLVDDENEFTPETNKLADMKRKQDSNEEEAVLEYSKIYENDKFNQELKKQRISGYTSALPGGWEYSQIMQNSPLNTKRNLVADEITNQLELYKDEQTANALSSNVSDITIDSDEGSNSSNEDIVLGLPDAPSERKNFDYLKQFISVLPKDIDMSQIINEKAYEPEISDDAMFDNIQLKPNVAISEDWLVQLELCNDINSSLTPYIADGNEPDNRRKSRITAADVDNILFSGFNKESLSANQISTPITSQKVSNLDGSVLDIYDEKYPKNISKVIYHMLSKSDVTSRSNKFPVIENDGKFSFADLLLNEQVTNEEDQIIKLGSALFDEHKLTDSNEYNDIDSSNSVLVKHLENLQQKKHFAEWLRIYNKPTIEELADKYKTDPLESVFIKVCAGDLKDAINLAMDSNNAHLAVVLTLIDSNDDAVKSTASNQLQYWNDTSSLGLIPKPIVKIYKILSGEFSDVLSDLPWNISLSIKLLYGDTSLKLFELIEDFDSGIIEKGPFYDILSLYNQMHTKDRNQALQLIKSSHLNIKLKWFFNLILAHGNTGNDVLKTDLSLAFGAFLEKIGLWKEALFVYSHISDDREAERVIKNLIICNIQQIRQSDNDETYITKVLKVPHSLIYEAIAIHQNSAGNFWEECEALVTAKLWEKAHECIVKELGPSTVISGSEDDQNRLLSLTAKFPESGLIIPTWSQGAGIYDNFIRLSKSTLEDLSSTEIRAILVFLLSNLPLQQDYHSPKCLIALKIMSKKVGDLALNYATHLENIKESVLSLPLGQVERNYFNIRLHLINI